MRDWALLQASVSLSSPPKEGCDFDYDPVTGGGFSAALLLVPCAVLVALWLRLGDTAHARAWLSTLLLGITVLAACTYLFVAMLLWFSPAEPMPPPGGILGASLASALFGQASYHESTGLMTGAALCLSMFLAPQFSIEGFPLAPVSPRRNGAFANRLNSKQNRYGWVGSQHLQLQRTAQQLPRFNAMASKRADEIRRPRDLPCIAAFSAFLNFFVAFALIAMMCGLRQRGLNAPTTLLQNDLVDAPNGTVPLFVFHSVVNQQKQNAAYANFVITVLSALGLTILAVLNMADFSVMISSLADDGLLPSAVRRLKGLPLAAASSAAGAILLRPAQLAIAMAAGPLLLNAIICLCVLAMRSCTRNGEDQRHRPAVFSYNLITGECQATDRHVRIRYAQSFFFSWLRQNRPEEKRRNNALASRRLPPIRFNAHVEVRAEVPKAALRMAKRLYCPRRRNAADRHPFCPNWQI
ncbi:low affinity cationic amino acid transporter 2-like [Tropilaelaps mercedesae]|uniref:Low affinity cationic amino acid transporter 2-like n=1 Tax=Tropilaelaps mercedesae TaxID=418985 RepID=A0A1V9WYC0_9ACAR|nr:low affinity cationic amino acid transporter 2-like [Tropilaelaps mercedesae]